jgi:hypothetical protein
MNTKDHGPYGFWGTLTTHQARRILHNQNVGDYIYYESGDPISYDHVYKSYRQKIADYEIMAVRDKGRVEKFIVSGGRDGSYYVAGKETTPQKGIDLLICQHKDVLKTALKFNQKHYDRIISSEKTSFFGKRAESVIDYVLERYEKECK